MSWGGDVAARVPVATPGGGLAGLAAKTRLALSAAAVFACTLLAAASFTAPTLVGDIATRSALATMRLATATCADWREAGSARRDALVGALTVAATAPDPESPGATLDRAAASAQLSRACSTRLSRSFLLFEVYNRAASFSPAAAGAAPALGGFGNGPHD